MKSMKKIFSLVLVLILALGCLGMNASADYPGYPPVQSVTVNGILAQFNVSGSSMTYNARISGANLSTDTFTVVVTISNISNLTSITLDGNDGTQSGSQFTWTNVSLTSSSQLEIDWVYGNNDRSGDFPLVIATGSGNASLQGLSIGGVTATPDSITVGGVTRYTYSAILGTNASLSNLTIAPDPVNDDTTTYKLDGANVTEPITANFTAQTHVLTVTDGAATQDYLLSACAPDSEGKITVYLGIRTWAAVDFNNNNYTHYNYSQYGTGTGSSSIDSTALSIDTVGSRPNSTAVASPTWTLDTNSNKYRPVFLTSEYQAVKVDPGDSVMDALVAYASSNTLTLTGVQYSYISDITSNTGSLGYGTCGWGDGWMYLVRYSNTDVATDLPNLAADNYIVTGGQYIDWIFTCAFGDDFGYGMW